MPTSTTTTRTLLPTLIVSALLGLTPALHAQGSEQHKLLPNDGQAGDVFGSAVATDGALVVAGAPMADHSGTASGSAYLFGAQSGAQNLELVPTDGASGDKFGSSVAFDGTRVAVGAPLADGVGLVSDSGAVYVFDTTSGLQLLKLEASDAAAGDQFGYDVAMDGGLVVVGALGAAYVFDASTGQQLEKLLPIGGSTTLGLSAFGEVVAIDGGLVVVGARLENGVSGISGAAYVYDAASGDQLHRLIALNGTAWAFFGACVSIDGDVIAIGAPEAGPKGKHSGAAYVFDASTGEQVHYLFPADGHVFANFGSSVGVDGQDVFIGSPQNNTGGLFSAGSVYLYDADSGSLVDKLVSSDVAALDEFGGAVSISEGVLVAGAARDDDNGDASGSTYVFGGNDVWQDLGGAKPGSNGLPALVGGGSMLGGESVTLEVHNGPAFATAHLVMGLTDLSAPFKGGTLVPNPDWILSPFTLDGTGGFFSSYAWPVGIPSGTDSYYQFWISDSGATFILSATNGLQGTTP